MLDKLKALLADLLTRVHDLMHALGNKKVMLLGVLALLELLVFKLMPFLLLGALALLGLLLLLAGLLICLDKHPEL